MNMSSGKTLHSLEDLSALLPDAEREKLSREVDPAGGEHDGKKKTVHVRMEKKGRKGKTVTLVTGLQHNPDTMEEIARTLKQHCGAGGTVKEGTIEIQGDNRDRVKEKLRGLNYIVK
jgi:translation initiation factor 1